MKRLLLGCLILFMLSVSAQAQMYWLGLNPTPKAGNAGDSGQVTDAGRGDAYKNWTGSYDGFEIELKIVDSSVGVISADSSSGTYYTYPLNTENVVSATGIFQILSITDSSTTTGHLFALGSADAPAGTGSTFVWYTVKTGYVPYDPNAHTLVAAVEATTVSGTAINVPITLAGEGDEVPDTLFKPWTWVEFTVWDSTRWGDKVSGPFDSVWTASGYNSSDTVAVGGTYTGKGAVGQYHIWMFDPGSDDDSIVWTHYANEGLAITVGTIAVAASAAATALDSGVTLTFDEEDFCDDGDVFIFHISDSLHYGKTVKCKMRVGLNVHKR